MTGQAITQLAALGQDVIALGRGITAEQWSAPSACAGWSVQDVISHLTSTLREVVAPDTVPAPTSDDIEASNEQAVAAYRDQSPQETLDAYERLLPDAILALRDINAGDQRDLPVDLLNAGTYPAHLIADSLVFDHYCHLRHDIAGPRGPLAHLEIPENAATVSVTLNWLLAGLPQMSPSSLALALTMPVQLNLTGPGGESWVIAPSADSSARIAVTAAEPGPAPAATMTSSTDDFILWGTRRASPDGLVELGGAIAVAAAVLQQIHVF